MASALKWNDPDKLARMLDVIFACAQSAWARRDFDAHHRAAEMYRKYKHLLAQARARHT